MNNCKKFFAFIRTVSSWVLLTLFAIIYAIPMGIYLLLPYKLRYNRFIFTLVRIFYWVMIKSSFLPITFVGRKNIPTDTNVIFAANHQSALDIPLVGILAKSRPHVWLARHELLNWKLLGRVLPHGAIVIHVDSPRKAVRSLAEAVDRIKAYNLDLMIFPEGQRFIDGDVHKFYRGFAVLAKKTNLPVVPVRILGAHKAYPPNSFLVYWHPIKVVVGPPFRYQEDDTDETFVARVHNWFLAQKD